MNKQLRQRALENTKRRFNNETISMADSTTIQIRNGSDSYLSRVVSTIESGPPFARQVVMLIGIGIVWVLIIWAMGAK